MAMNKTPEEIISNAAVEKVHGHANFGERPKRRVIDEGVVNCAFGYANGHTMMTILREHGLITEPKGYSCRLTKKGQQYLRAIFRNVPLRNLLDLAI